MNKLIHNITVTVFEKNENNLSVHSDIFEYLLPVNFEKEHIEFSIESVEGLQQKPIFILKLKTNKKKHNTLILDKLFSNLDKKAKKSIGSELYSRLNQEGYFFIRLKKSELIQKKFQLTNSGDCYHFKIKLAGFPSNWEQFVNSGKLLLNRYKCLDKEA